jgi:hypothetical protein
MNKKYNNPLATIMVQGIKAKIHSRLAFTINEGHDVQRVIEAKRRDRPGRCHDDDDNDRFPAFTSNINDKSYPKEFKPVRIPKYDGKQDPRQWI